MNVDAANFEPTDIDEVNEFLGYLAEDVLPQLPWVTDEMVDIIQQHGDRIAETVQAVRPYVSTSTAVAAAEAGAREAAHARRETWEDAKEEVLINLIKASGNRIRAVDGGYVVSIGDVRLPSPLPPRLRRLLEGKPVRSAAPSAPTTSASII